MSTKQGLTSDELDFLADAGAFNRPTRARRRGPARSHRERALDRASRMPLFPRKTVLALVILMLLTFAGAAYLSSSVKGMVDVASTPQFQSVMQSNDDNTEQMREEAGFDGVQAVAGVYDMRGAIYAGIGAFWLVVISVPVAVYAARRSRWSRREAEDRASDLYADDGYEGSRDPDYRSGLTRVDRLDGHSRLTGAGTRRRGR